MTPPEHADPLSLEFGDYAIRVRQRGAEMQSLHHRGRALLWHGDTAFWGGRSPVLFPIVGRAPDDQLGLDDGLFPMPQHGFARISDFRLTGHGADASGAWCCHELTDSPETRARYPRAFRLILRHALGADGLRISARVENHDSRDLPFGLGFHPAFLWPLPGAEGLAHHIRLENGAAPALHRLAGGLYDPRPQGSPFHNGLLELAPGLFAEDAALFPEGAGPGLSYGAARGPRLRFGFENLPNLALWTKPGAPFLCIEPWHGLAAAVGAGPAITQRPYGLVLPPAAAADFALTVQITDLD